MRPDASMPRCNCTDAGDAYPDTGDAYPDHFITFRF